MANQINQLDRENLNLQGGKINVQPSQLLSNVNKLAFEEVGNKIHENGKENINKLIDIKPLPLGAIKKTVSIRTRRPAIGKTVVNKKADKPITKLDIINEPNACKKTTKAKQQTNKPNSISDAPLSYSSRKLIDIIEIDISNNPLYVSEYVQDIYNYLLELEDQFSIEKHFLNEHKSTPDMRSGLVNWMVDVHIKFKLFLETLHLSIAIVDRYLQLNKQIRRDTLQLVGATAIWIASKYEDRYILDMEEMVYICGDMYSKHQIVEMERQILKSLEFNLGRPLSLQFLRRFSQIANVNSEQHTLGKYLLELGLINYEVCHIKPSIQAAAACCLSISILHDLPDPKQAWSEVLVHYSNYTYSEIKPTIVLLTCALNKIKTSKYKSIYNKYSHTRYSKISVNPKLKDPLVKKLSETIQ